MNNNLILEIIIDDIYCNNINSLLFCFYKTITYENYWLSQTGNWSLFCTAKNIKLAKWVVASINPSKENVRTNL